MSTHAMDERLALRADRKVIIHKSGGEVSLVEQLQDIIEYAS